MRSPDGENTLASCQCVSPFLWQAPAQKSNSAHSPHLRYTLWLRLMSKLKIALPTVDNLQERHKRS